MCKYAPDSARLAVFGLVLETVRDVPGAAVAAVASDVPFTEPWHLTGLPPLEWQAAAPVVSADAVTRVGARAVSSGPFAFGMRFVARHSAGTLGAWRHRVAAINETLARQWSPVSPIGERVRLGDREWVTIIAVVGDTRQWLDQPPSPGIFLALDVCTPVQARSGVRIAYRSK